MAKKPSSRKSLKSLFSKSEVSVKEAVEKNEHSDEREKTKKKFKLFKFKINSKNDSVPEKPAVQNQKVSTVRLDRAVEDGAVQPDTSSPDSQRSSLYATASRSKVKDLSYSELDLRKPKRFGTFTFGLKRKKKAEDNFSKSTEGLNCPENKEQEEEPLDLTQWELNQPKKKIMFTMSQPELDNIDTFDIPSPPPVATNQLETHIPFSYQSQSVAALHNQPLRPLMNSSSDVSNVMGRAPIATISELEWDEPTTAISSEKKESIAVQNDNPIHLLYDPANPTSHSLPISAVSAEVLPPRSNPVPSNLPPAPHLTTSGFPGKSLTTLGASEKVPGLDTTVHNSVCVSEGSSGDVVRKQPKIKADMCVTERTYITLSLDQPDAHELSDFVTLRSDPSLVAFDSKIDTTVSEPAHKNIDLKKDYPTPHNKVPVFPTKTSMPETAVDVTKTIASVNTYENGTPSTSKVLMYGALYESLFPQSFASEVFSAISKPGFTETIDLDRVPLAANSDSALSEDMQSLSTYSCYQPHFGASENVHQGAECAINGSELNVACPNSSATIKSDIPVSGMDTSEDGFTHVDTSNATTNTIIESNKDVFNILYDSLFPQSFHQLSTTANPEQLSCVTHTGLASPQANQSIFLDLASETADDIMYADNASIMNADNSACSEITLSRFGVRSDNFGHTLDSVASFAEVQNATSPFPDNVRSLGADSPASDFQKREVFVTDTDTTMTSAEPRCPSLLPEMLAAEKPKETHAKTMEEIFLASFGQVDGNGVYHSPEHGRIGSDDSSTMEVYYSAEEDNADESVDEEMYTLDGKEEMCSVDGRKEMPDIDYTNKKGQREVGLSVEVLQQESLAKISHSTPQTGNEKGDLIHGVKMEGEDKGPKFCYEDKQLRPCSQAKIQEECVCPLLSSEQEKGAPVLFLKGSDGSRQEERESTQAWLPMKEEKAKEKREVEAKEELPAAPVRQVDTVMECESALPSTELHQHREGDIHSETEDHLSIHPLLPDEEIKCLVLKDTWSNENIHIASSKAQGKDTFACTNTVSSESEKKDLNTFREAEDLDAPATAVDTEQTGAESAGSSQTNRNFSINNSRCDTPTETVGIPTPLVRDLPLAHRAELQPISRDAEHNRSAQNSEWVDTLAGGTDRSGTVSEQVAVELSVTAADTQGADITSQVDDHPPETQPSLPQGFLNVTGVYRSVMEVFASDIQSTNADQELVDIMNLGYSTLSTTLTTKPSSPPESRFRNVSLLTEDNTMDLGKDTMDASGPNTLATESNRAERGSSFPEYKWRNRFEGAFQYKPDPVKMSSLSDSLSAKMSDTHLANSHLSSSALPEANVYTRHLTSSSSPETHSSLANRLSDKTQVYLSRESASAAAGEGNEFGWSIRQWEETSAPAGERESQKEREPAEIKSVEDLQLLPLSSFLSARPTGCVDDNDSLPRDDSSSDFSGVFKATRVELVPDPTSPFTSPISPDTGSPYNSDMKSLVDTLKSIDPPPRQRRTGGPPVLFSSLPPIVEDAPSLPTSSTTTPTLLPSTIKSPPGAGATADASSGLYSLPTDLGLKRSTPRETRTPLDLMKLSQQDQQQPGNRGLKLPSRVSAAATSIVMKNSSDFTQDLPSPLLNGNGVSQSPNGSRLDNSFLFSSYRSASIDQPQENGKGNTASNRLLFRTGSLPDAGSSYDRMSTAPRELGGLSTGTDQHASRYDRFSFLLNSSSGSLPGAEDSNSRMSRPPQLSFNSPPSNNSPTHHLSPSGSLDLHRPFITPDSPLSTFSQTHGVGMGASRGIVGNQVLQRSFNSESSVGVQQSPLFNSVQGGSFFQSQEPVPDRTLVSKYRAFPDAYLTKEKEHGKLNPRPGKMFLFDRPGMCGQRIEIRGDVIDATPWQLQETISIRVIRGGWVLYEKPNFKGEKIALDEGEVELTYPFSPPEEEGQQLENRQEEQGGERANKGGSLEQNGEQTQENKPARRFIIGSVRRAVRDYSVPDISLFPEEDAEGKKVVFRDTSDDARIFGFPIKANSVIINAGLWLVYAQPFFQGIPRVLEVGGYPNPAAWGVEQPYVGSLHPLKIGEPKVEKPDEPQMVIYDKPYFTGKSRTIYTNMKDFMTRTDRQQTAFMYSVGSLKVLGGIWVGYEKEGFRGHQYVLEEGEYHDWRVWGGCDSELRSVRVIRADLKDPMLVMFEQPDEEQGDMQEENTFEVTQAIPDVEPFGYKTNTLSIHVTNGAWIAYSHVDFSGHQYILEKGFYNNCADWGSEDTRICSVQPILLAPSESSNARNKILLYSEPDFHGECHVCDQNQEALSDKILTKSCRVIGGSWVLYEGKQHTGDLYVLSEGEYPNFVSMGCASSCTIRSLQAVPMMFSIPSISLFGLECMEGREITTDMEVINLVEEGFNNHILSVRINSGCWVICEHSNYRGRQFLLEPIEITNWPKFSSLQTIGSMYPVRQRRRFFRIRNKERGHFLSIQGGVEEMKTGRVVVMPQVEAMSDIWFYQDGLIKNRISPTMSLQVMGNIEPAAKVVLWSETRQPIQTWKAQMRGSIISLTFPGMVLDVKGGKTYDKDHVVVMPESEERPSQQWELELL